MRVSYLLAVVLAVTTPAAPVLSQVTVLREPASLLLTDTRDWSRESPLGDLRERPNSPGYIELRVWAGYGLDGTDAVVMRREHGSWKAWYANTVPCMVYVPDSIGDTASDSTLRGYRTREPRHCGRSMDVPTPPDTSEIDADTLVIQPIHAPSRAIDQAWKRALAAGLLTLPARVPRTWIMMDGLTYVIELRRGNEYRASEIEYVTRPEVPADSLVKLVFAAVAPLVPKWTANR